MNPILHDLHNKQWVWTAAHAKQQQPKKTLATGFPSLDNVLTGGFPRAGMIHLNSPLGCGEVRLMLSVLRNCKQSKQTQKLFVFIDPPFELNAEFLVAHNIPLEQLILVNTQSSEECLWSAEQCAKSGACEAVFIWQPSLKHIQVKKLEHAALQGECYCIWMHNEGLLSGQSLQKPEKYTRKKYVSRGKKCQGELTTSIDKQQALSNLPLSLSLSIKRELDELNITVNKQKIGWAQKPINIPLPFINRTNRLLKRQLKYSSNNKVLSIKRASSEHNR